MQFEAADTVTTNMGFEIFRQQERQAMEDAKNFENDKARATKEVGDIKAYLEKLTTRKGAEADNAKKAKI